jgi:hypothetical protein
VLDGLGRRVGQVALGRTASPTCGTPLPAWATHEPAALDVLLACGTNNAGRAELKVKNNRGLIQQLDVPSPVAFVDVEEQPEPIRQLVRTVAAGADTVLLPSGKEARFGFTQPAADRQATLTPRLSTLALATELAVQLADLAVEGGSMAVLPALLSVGACTGLQSDIAAGVVPETLPAMKALVERCSAASSKPPRSCRRRSTSLSELWLPSPAQRCRWCSPTRDSATGWRAWPAS